MKFLPLLFVLVAFATINPTSFFGQVSAEASDSSGEPVTQSVDAPTEQNVAIEFLSPQSAGDIVVGDETDKFVSELYPREAAAMTGVPRGDKTIEESREAANVFFRKALLEFEQEEKDALETVTRRVVEKFESLYPLLIDRPWRFIKTRRDLCGGFSFTRGDCIVLSEPTLARFIEASKLPRTEKSRAESLLLHEQMHVLQRTSPELLKPLYEKVFSFHAAKVNLVPWVQERQVSNPDGLDDNWVAEIRQDGDTKPYWIGTILPANKPLHQMGRDFVTIAVPLSKNESNEYAMRLSKSEDGAGEGVPEYVLLEELKSFTSRFPIRGGYDHPNEVSAYLFTAITHNELPESVEGEAAEVLNATQEWFKQNLKNEEQKETHDEE